MMKRFLVFGIICLTITICVNNAKVLAAKKDEKKPVARPVIEPVPYKQKVFGTVGEVEYVDFSARKSMIALKDKDGNSIKVSLKDLKAGATILVTYRKEEDKKGKEKDVLISLSVIKNSGETKTSKGRK